MIMFRRFLFLCCIALLSACATPKQFAYIETAESKVWPPPPLAPRYQFMGYLEGETNLVSAQAETHYVRDFFSFLLGVVFGDEEPLKLERPYSGYVDSDQQRIYVADGQGRKVIVFDVNKNQVLNWQNSSEYLGFVTPVGIAKGANDTLLVSDAGLGVIVILDQSGDPVGRIDHVLLERPAGIVRHAKSGLIFVADTPRHVIRVFNDQGELLRTIGKKGDQALQFNSPTHLALHNDELYVSDTLNSRIQVLGVDGKYRREFGKRGLYLGNMPRPKGVAVDPEGRIYVVESYYDYLLVYDAQGRPLLPIGGSGRGAGQFNLPSGVWTDDAGKIYVADMFNNRVAVFQYIFEDTINSDRDILQKSIPLKIGTQSKVFH